MSEQASGAMRFERRNACPACTDTSGAILLDLAFDANPISSYLHSFYGGRLDPRRLSSGRFTLVECSTCHLIFQREVLDDAALSELYSTIASASLEETQQGRGLQVRRRYASQVEQLLKHFNRSPAEVNVLDFGGGWGLWLDMAAGYGCQTAAAEIVTEKKLTADAGGHEVFDIASLPEQRFDFVNTEQVVEHLTDPCGVLSVLAKSVRVGGLLRVSVPNGTGTKSLLQRPDWRATKGSAASLNAVAPLEHVNCFEHESLKRLVFRSGEFELFNYPLRQFIDPMERVRFLASGFRHVIRRPAGTMLLFRRTG